MKITRSRIAHILIISMSVMILVGIILSTVLYYVNRKTTSENFTVVLKKDTLTAAPFSVVLTGMRPGEQEEYTVLLKAEREAERKIYMEFTETENKGLPQFVEIEIFANGESVAKMPLEDIFEADPVCFTCHASMKEPVQIKIVYLMSLDVGNEAMGTSSKFEIKISSDR